MTIARLFLLGLLLFLLAACNFGSRPPAVLEVDGYVNPKAPGFSIQFLSTINEKQSWGFLPAPLRVDFEGVYLRDGFPNLFVKYHFSYPLPEEDFIIELTVEPEFPFITQWDSSRREMIVIPEGALSSEETYTFFLDLKGVVNSPYEDVEIEASHQYATPRIHVFLTREDDTDRNSPFIFEFNYPMRPKSVATAISLVPSVDYVLEWQNGNRTAVLTLIEPYPTDTELHIFLALSARDVSGNNINLPREWAFDFPPVAEILRNIEPISREPTSNLSPAVETTKK